MLAQNFLSAADLKLRDYERDALIKTLVLMETDKLTYVKPAIKRERGDSYDIDRQLPFTGHFNMANWRVRRGCETICCIGGTAELVGHVDLIGRADHVVQLGELLYPPITGRADKKDGWATITINQAAQALRNYLTNGKANWARVLKAQGD